jgi:hypothetical protein
LEEDEDEDEDEDKRRIGKKKGRREEEIRNRQATGEKKLK